jgi:hypothetical protein
MFLFKISWNEVQSAGGDPYALPIRKGFGRASAPPPGPWTAPPILCASGCGATRRKASPALRSSPARRSGFPARPRPQSNHACSRPATRCPISAASVSNKLQHGPSRRRKRPRPPARSLAAQEIQWPPFGLSQIDVKDLSDLPGYRELIPFGLPRFQYTARVVPEGSLWLAFISPTRRSLPAL